MPLGVVWEEENASAALCASSTASSMEQADDDAFVQSSLAAMNKRQQQSPSPSSCFNLSRPGAPAPIEDDDEHEEDCRCAEARRRHCGTTTATTTMAPPIIRPISVLRPVIPVFAVENFYQQAHQRGMGGDLVHSAAMESHEWHRKWSTPSQQEGSSSSRLLPQATSYYPTTTTTITGIPDHYAYDSSLLHPATTNADGDDHHCDDNKRRRGSNDDDKGIVVPEVVSGEMDASLLSPLSSSCTPTSSFEDAESDSRSGSTLGPVKRQRFVTNDLEPHAVEPENDEPLPVTTTTMPRSALHRPVPLRAWERATILEREEESPPREIQVAATLVAPQPLRVVLPPTRPRTVSPLSEASSSSCTSTILSQNDEDDDEGEKREPPKTAEEDESSASFTPPTTNAPSPSKATVRSNASSAIETARDGLLHALATARGDVVANDAFYSHLKILKKHYKAKRRYRGDTGITTNTTTTTSASDGVWLALTKPTFFGCCGENDRGDPMYTMGRMSFDMFSPTSLVVSLQGNFNVSTAVTAAERSALLRTGQVPASLLDEVRSGKTLLKTYNLVTAFTVEPSLAAWPDAPNRDVRRPIRGIMTTYGYSLPDPKKSNRQTVWITGGRIEPNDDAADVRDWKRLFAQRSSLPKRRRGLREQAKLLAAKLLVGIKVPEAMDEETGTMEYSFSRPMGGHGQTYVDTLYADDAMRVTRGHRGTYFCFSKLSSSSSTAAAVGATTKD